MIRWRLGVLFLGMILLAACGSNQGGGGFLSAVNTNPNQPVSGDVDRLVAVPPQVPSDETIQDRIILKDAELSLVVSDAEESITQITTMAEKMGGWVVSSRTTKAFTDTDSEVAQGSITIRIPAARLNEAIETIKAGALSVDSEQITGQDVTQGYIDLSSQLANLQAAERRLQSIMENATTTADVLQVNSELTQVRGEIETVQGRIRYYDESAAFSAISVTLTPDALHQPLRIGSWNPGGTLESAIALLINILHFLVDVAIVVIVVVLPLALIFGLPSWFIYRRVKGRKAG